MAINASEQRCLKTFLQLHGYELIVSDRELLAVIVDVAAGEIDDGAFVHWVHERAHRPAVRRRKKLHAAVTKKERLASAQTL